ncbi:hypothetical protein [Pseudomonas orientalis]|uniref:hypothetical protein n=1 Tax=Pseudomonas orientalis TaxID=76758 RepID=UPI000F58CAD3|nr:hypothetical protein [Pseudomonas orientalis]
MTDDLNSNLDDIFNARAERLNAASNAKRELEIKQDATVQQFLELKEAIIRPTLEALAQKLSDRGQECKIFETQDGEQVSGLPRGASIGIRFLLDSGAQFGRGNDYPHLTLALEKAARKVQFYSSTMVPGRGGMAGGDGSADIGEVTEELINKKALKIIADVFR